MLWIFETVTGPEVRNIEVWWSCWYDGLAHDILLGI